MKRQTCFLAAILWSILWAGAVALPLRAQPSDAQTGRWEIDFRGREGKVKLELRLSRDRMHQSTGLALGEFAGLSDEVIARGGQVSFRLERPAGLLTFEGEIERGYGDGTFRFEPSQAFRDGIDGLGYDRPDGREMLVLAMQGVDLSFARDLKQMGFRSVDTDDLVKAAIFDITPAFAAEMRGLGLDEPSLEDLVKMRIFDVNAELVASFGRLGFEVREVEELVKLRVHDVDPEFVEEVRRMGFDPTLEELVKMRIFDVDSAFVAEMAAAGLSGLDIDELVELRIFDVDREYIEEMKALGAKGEARDRGRQRR